MGLAKAAKTRATCPARQVGCVIVDKDHNVIATGYNGSAPGDVHCSDVGCLVVDGHCKRTLHAEANAIDRCSRWKRRGGSIYCTVFPCVTCATLLTKSGIAEVVYDEPYHSYQEQVVLDMFAEHGIVVRPIGE